MDTGFQISLFLLRGFSFSLYIIIFMYSLGFAKIGASRLILDPLLKLGRSIGRMLRPRWSIIPGSCRHSRNHRVLASASGILLP